MTDSPHQQIVGKRDRLIESAMEQMHRQGVQATTLADIAHAAGVPIGNVYYYFKTKDDLVGAAVEARVKTLSAALASLEDDREPRVRLKALVRMFVGQRELIARYGCPQGTLCSELDKSDDPLSRSAARLMQLPIDWAEQQFRAMGRADARDLANALMAAYEGIALLANTFRDPDLMTREGDRLERWIDDLA